MHFTGFILARLSDLARSAGAGGDRITISGHQVNGAHGVHQARVTLVGDPATYRLILAPADAPISIAGRPAEEYFAQPLGDR